MTLTPEQIAICNEAFNKYGYVDQKDQLVEEMAELTFALNKFKRKPSEERLIGILEEIADVQIMLEQFVEYYGRNEVQKHIDYKVNRLLNRISS